MRSHYVPKMYLKGWQTVHNNRQRQICVYRKAQKPEFKSIREIGCSNDLYTKEAEEWLDREIENKCEPLLRKMIRTTAFSTSEKIRFGRFLLVLWFRVPFSLNGLFQQIREQTAPQTHKEMEALRDALKEFGLPDEIFNIERFKTPEFNKEVYSQLLMRDRYRQHVAFAVMHWRLYRAAPGKEFITSDNPVFFDRRIGLNNPESRFIFPVNKDLLLMGRKTRLRGSYLETVNEEKTDEFNLEIIRNCDSEVYASIEDPETARKVDAYAGDDKSIKHEIKIVFE